MDHHDQRIAYSVPRLADEQMLAVTQELATRMHARRTVRDFAPDAVPRAVIEAAIHAACSAPSGANQQPWRFVAVSDPALKHQIREAAEAEEREFYTRRAPEPWLQALAPLGTDAHKPFLDTAPWLIAIFYERFAFDADGEKVKRYYPHESVGIATGMLITALHLAGLCTLTHTPSPMGFLNNILSRPSNEMAYLLLVVGHPATDCSVPDVRRLPLSTTAVFK